MACAIPAPPAFVFNIARGSSLPKGAWSDSARYTRYWDVGESPAAATSTRSSRPRELTETEACAFGNAVPPTKNAPGLDSIRVDGHAAYQAEGTIGYAARLSADGRVACLLRGGFAFHAHTCGFNFGGTLAERSGLVQQR